MLYWILIASRSTPATSLYVMFIKIWRVQIAHKKSPMFMLCSESVDMMLLHQIHQQYLEEFYFIPILELLHGWEENLFSNALE
jgi:hypothetical protein